MWRCVICFESNQDSVGSTPCGHHFHQGCFNSWASHCRTRNIPPTCPLCTAEAYFLEPGAPPLTTSSDHGQESDSAQEELLSDIEQEESNDEYSYYDSSDAGSGGGVEDSFLTDFTDRSVSWGLSEEDAQGTIEEETKEEEEVDDVQSPSNPMNSIAEMTQELALTEDHPHPRLLQELLGGIGLNPIDFGSVNVLPGDQNALFFRMKALGRGKKCVADSALAGEPDMIITSTSDHDKDFRDWVNRVKDREETIHSRLKSFNVLANTFRHGKGTKDKMEKHKACTESVAVIVQYDFDCGHPPFEVDGTLPTRKVKRS